jgi:type II secretory pathway component GspD/PulD (secretin)
MKFKLMALAAFAGLVLSVPVQADNAQPAPLAAKLKATKLSLDFNNATLAEATNFLRVEAKRLSPDHAAINFVISPDATTAARPVTLTLNNVSMEQALQSVCELAGVTYAVDGDVVRLLAPNEKPPEGAAVAIAAPPDDQAAQATMHKLQTIIIDKINFQNLDIAAAVQFLGAKSRELDPEHAGVNFVLDAGPPGANIHRELSMTLEQVPLADLIREIEAQTHLHAQVGANLVTFRP